MKIRTIIKKEYREIVKKKSFLISTILTPLLMGAFLFVPLLLTRVGRETKTIVIEDFSGIVQEQFLEKGKRKEVKSQLKLAFKGMATASAQQNAFIKKYERDIEEKEDVFLQLTEDYRQKILNEEINGLILIPENVKDTRRVYFCALNIADMGANKYISSSIQKILSEKILTEQNIPLELVEKAIKDVTLNTLKVKEEGTSKASSGTEYIMSFVMYTILLMIIMMYGQLIMRGIIDEKNNRIVEVLISSARPQTLFYGKIIGIGLAALTQVGIWFVLGLAFMSRAPAKMTRMASGFLTLELAVYFIIFFVIGYFMYSILFSIVGASVNTDQEAQQYSAPISYALFVPFLIGMLVTQDPNTPMVTVASLFPLFTPLLMFMRISIAVPPFYQIALSIVISLLSTYFLAWLGAKIFRVGILMYGKKPSVKEILRWIRYR
ncbi:MAG: ABC transporter permease [bacterium]|nr:ABC transporter permease [bacterium]